MAEMAAMRETVEELNLELDQVIELNWQAIEADWEIEALEKSRESRMDATVVELYKEYKELAPSFARQRLEEDSEYQRLVGRIEQLRRTRSKRSTEVCFRMNRIIIDMVEYVVKNAPWFSASARSLLDLVN